MIQAMRQHIVFGAVAAVLLTGCGTRPADEPEPGPSSPSAVAYPDADGEFEKMMTQQCGTSVDFSYSQVFDNLKRDDIQKALGL